LHQILGALYFSLRQTNDVYVVFGVFSELLRNLPRVQDVLLVEQIVQFSAVNFVKGDPGFHIGEVLDFLKNVNSSQQVQSPDVGSISKHGMCFSASSLPVGKARDFGPIEGAID